MKQATHSTRERILQQGLDLLSETGLSGVTLGVLADQVGMSKSGLFAHFRSKEDVQIALLQQMTEVASATVVLPAMGHAAGLPRLTALVHLWLGWTKRAGLRGGCPIASALFELDDIEGPVRDKVLAMESHWRGLLGQMVQETIDLGQLSPTLDKEQFVWELCGIYLSHHASYRFIHDPSADTRAYTAFESLLERSGAEAQQEAAL